MFFNNLRMPIKIYIYFRKKHPKQNKLAVTDMREKPVDLFNHTGVKFCPLNFCQLWFLCRSVCFFSIYYLLCAPTEQLKLPPLTKIVFSTQSQENTISMKYSFHSKNYKHYRDGNSANFIFGCCHKKKYFKSGTFPCTVFLWLGGLYVPQIALYYFVEAHGTDLCVRV